MEPATLYRMDGVYWVRDGADFVQASPIFVRECLADGRAHIIDGPPPRLRWDTPPHHSAAQARVADVPGGRYLARKRHDLRASYSAQFATRDEVISLGKRFPTMAEAIAACADHYARSR